MGFQLDPCNRIQHRRGLDIHEPAHIGCKKRIRHAAVDGLVPVDRTEHLEERMAPQRTWQHACLAAIIVVL